MTTAKTSSTARRTRLKLARFIMTLGACSVPLCARKAKSAVGAWQAADTVQRKWVFHNLNDKLGVRHILTGAPCWCARGPNAKEKKAIFNAYRRHARTGKLEAA